MKKKCKVLSLLLSFIVVLSVGMFPSLLIVPVFSKSITVNPTICQFSVGQISYHLKGGRYYLDERMLMDAPLLLSHHRAMIAIRAFDFFHGIKMAFYDEPKEVNFKLGDKTIKLYVNKSIAWVDNQSFTLDAVPYIQNGRTMVPLRFIAEQFGCQVSWDQTQQTITCVYNDPPYELPKQEALTCHLVLGNPYFTVKKATADQEEQIKHLRLPEMKNGRIMVSANTFSFIATIVVRMNIDRETYFSMGGKTVKMAFDKNVAWVNYQEIPLDAPAYMIAGRAYYPMQFILEHLGWTVTWDSTSQTLACEYPGN